MITGKHPFYRKTTMETLSAIINEEPAPLDSLNSQVPQPLRWIIDRCLAKNPEDRYGSTRDLLKDIRNIRDHFSAVVGSDQIVPIKKSKKNKTLVLALTSIAVVIAGILGFLIWKQLRTQKILPARSFEKIKITRLTTTGKPSEGAISPDGKYLVYVQSLQNNKEAAWLRQIATGTDVQILARSDDYWEVTISPDGQFEIRQFFSSTRIAQCCRDTDGSLRSNQSESRPIMHISSDGMVKVSAFRGPETATNLGPININQYNCYQT